MRDRREEILARLVVIANTITGVQVFRNRDNIPETERPAICILDADEFADAAAQEKGLRYNRGKNIVSLTPEIYILASSDADNIGSTINAIRMKLLKAVLEDNTLASACGSNGRADYLGCDSQFATGRKMNGDMSVKFSFTYPLLPEEY